MKWFLVHFSVWAVIWLVIGAALQGRLSPALASELSGISSGVSTASASDCHTFAANLNGTQEVPPNLSSATGFGGVVLSPDETTVTVTLTYSGLSGDQIGAHIHGPASPGLTATIIFILATSGGPSETLPALQFSVTPTQVADLRNGLWYFNVHSGSFPNGEIRGQITCICGYTAHLTGAQEVPPNQSEGFGDGNVTLSPDETQILAALTFQNLSNIATAAHIHGPAFPGVNAPVIFPFSGITGTNGSYTMVFSVNPTQVTQLRSGQWYFNVHSSTYPGGEIRGQIWPECRIFLPVVMK